MSKTREEQWQDADRDIWRHEEWEGKRVTVRANADYLNRLEQERDELRAAQRPLMAGRYTVVWTNAEKNVWFTTRVQNVADGAAAVLAVQMDAAGEVTVINVFEGWPAEADEYDDLEGLDDEDEDDSLIQEGK